MPESARLVLGERGPVTLDERPALAKVLHSFWDAAQKESRLTGQFR
jgi:hypothetical protein